MYPPEKEAVHEDLHTPLYPPTGKEKLLLLLKRFQPEPVLFFHLSTIIFIEIGLCQALVYIICYAIDVFAILIIIVLIIIPVIGVIGGVKRVKVLSIIWAVICAILLFFAVLYVPLSLFYLIFDGLDHVYLTALSLCILFLYAMAFYSSILMIKSISAAQNIEHDSLLPSGINDGTPVNVTTSNLVKRIPDPFELQVIFTAGIILTLSFSNLVDYLSQCCGNISYWVFFISYGCLFVAGIFGIVGAYLRSKVFCGIYLGMAIVLNCVITLTSWISTFEYYIELVDVIYLTYTFFGNTLILLGLIASGVVFLIRHEKAVTLFKTKDAEPVLY